jgi:anti-sigma-K factor RskA
VTEQEFAELSAGYALNALSPDERDAFEAAFAAHPEWSHLVDADARTAAALASTVSDVAPPLTLRSTLLSRIAELPQGAAPVTAGIAAETERAAPAVGPPTTTTIQAVSRRRWTRSLLALAASFVLLVSIGFGAANLGQWLGRTDAQIALAEIQQAPDAQTASGTISDGGTATAHWSESVGKVVLVSEGLPSLATDETFELWFVRADGTPVSAGTFAGSGDEATALMAGSMEPGDTIAVTVEEAGGAPDGTPTTDPIVAIPTA